ncbi:MAG: coproporphyrinogen III oxidase, partial [Alphaproteobacteria bacterium]|nr:coproporphyrinogen III oxidase [Alphaproteobacteria bacterium]
GHGIAEQRALPAAEQAAEALLMGLRLTEGIDLAALAARFGMGRGALVDEDALARLRGLGLVWIEGDRIGVAPPGRGVLDALLGEIVADGLVAA